MKKQLFTWMGNGLAVPFVILAIGAGVLWVLAQKSYEVADKERFQSY